MKVEAMVRVRLMVAVIGSGAIICASVARLIDASGWIRGKGGWGMDDSRLPSVIQMCVGAMQPRMWLEGRLYHRKQGFGEFQ